MYFCKILLQANGSIVCINIETICPKDILVISKQNLSMLRNFFIWNYNNKSQPWKNNIDLKVK